MIPPTESPIHPCSIGASCQGFVAGDRARARGVWHVLGQMAGRAQHRRDAEVARPAHDGRLVRRHRHALPGHVVARMAVHAARMRQHARHLGEDHRRALGLVLDGVEVRDLGQIRPERGERPEREGRPEGRARDQAGQHQRPHQTAPVGRIGRRRGVPCPSARQALATAGATGGTPGSPTPVGDSALSTIETSTCGISPIRSIR